MSVSIERLREALECLEREAPDTTCCAAVRELLAIREAAEAAEPTANAVAAQAAHGDSSKACTRTDGRMCMSCYIALIAVEAERVAWSARLAAAEARGLERAATEMTRIARPHLAGLIRALEPQKP